MRVKRVGLCAAVLAMPAAVKAEPIRGLYIGGGAGYDILQSIQVTPFVAGIGAPSVRLNGSNGLAALGSVGYGLGNGLRLEVEGDFLRDGLKAPSVIVGPLLAPPLGALLPAGTRAVLTSNSHVLSYGVMANAFYDFNIGVPYVSPYLGAGAGVIWNDVTHSGKFAYQLIGGLSFPVSFVPGLALTAEYRFLDVTAGERYNATVATPIGGIPVSLHVGAQLHHSFLLGVRYAFNAPVAPPPPAAPAPVAVPAPAPARSYLVFFDWDRATLTDRARQIIREAADNSRRVQYTSIEVNGYTDTSGRPDYNKRLSMRRAEAVAAELTRDGVPRSAIAIEGFGETHLLVPTGPGVREPQNRRVEIIIR